MIIGIGKRLCLLLGKNVEVEGTFPILRETVVYAPARGRVVCVCDGGSAGWFIGLVEEGDKEATLYALSGVRSVREMPDASGEVRNVSDVSMSPQRLEHFLDNLRGRNIVVEGPFPIPLPNGQIAYSPAVGKLVDFHYGLHAGADWFLDIEEQNKKNTSLFSLRGVRSIHVVETRIAKPPPGLVLS